jgi:hypothetical protein
VNTFRNAPPDLGTGRLDQLSQAFGMEGRAAGQEALALDQGGKSLRIIRDTGAMMFRNGDAAGKAVGQNVPNANQGRNAADKFVRDNDLLPHGGGQTSQGDAVVVTSRSQNQEGGPTTNHQAEVVVTYTFKLQGKAVEGPGAKAVVTVGDGGAVTSFTRTMPDVAVARSVQTKSGQQAMDELRQKGNWNMIKQGGGPPKEIHIKNARAAFWVEDPGRGAGEIEPCYIFTGTAVGADGRDIEFMQKVSAVAGQAEPTLPSSPSQPPRQ